MIALFHFLTFNFPIHIQAFKFHSCLLFKSILIKKVYRRQEIRGPSAPVAGFVFPLVMVVGDLIVME
ncbi:MAG: hypothetical protein KJ908_07680, partial [Acidobacteria bacterium]|nr:hypothetical protein [Acidobacteriota bacterium]